MPTTTLVHQILEHMNAIFTTERSADNKRPDFETLRDMSVSVLKQPSAMLKSWLLPTLSNNAGTQIPVLA